MSDEIIKVLDAIGDKFGIMIDWTQQNVQPYIQDLCQRVVQYKLTTSIVMLVIATIILSIGVIWMLFTIIKIIRHKYCDLDDISGFQITCFVISPIIIAIGLILTSFMINDICMCHFIPEKILINEIQVIMK